MDPNKRQQHQPIQLHSMQAPSLPPKLRQLQPKAEDGSFTPEVEKMVIQADGSLPPTQSPHPYIQPFNDGNGQVENFESFATRSLLAGLQGKDIVQRFRAAAQQAGMPSTSLEILSGKLEAVREQVNVPVENPTFEEIEARVEQFRQQYKDEGGIFAPRPAPGPAEPLEPNPGESFGDFAFRGVVAGLGNYTIRERWHKLYHGTSHDLSVHQMNGSFKWALHRADLHFKGQCFQQQ